MGAGDKENQSLRELVEAAVVDAGVVEKVKRPGPQQQFVQQVHVVHLVAGHLNSGRNVAAQIEQAVKFYDALAPPKLRPVEVRQARVDDCGIENVEGVFQFDGKRFVLIKRPGLVDQEMGEIGIDVPVVLLVGVGRGVARNIAPNAHVI